MTTSLPEPDFGRLSVAERLELISQLWDSIPDSAEAFPIPEWHRHEILRRVAEADAAPEAGIPWDVVKARLREQS